MKRVLARLAAGFCVSFLAWCSPACNNADPGAGSNTNWLRACAADDECADGLSCLCGVCTAPCKNSCNDLPSAVCARSGSASVREQCAGSSAPESGLCLPACAEGEACDIGQFCSDGGCIQLAGAEPSVTSCGSGVQLELSSAARLLQARYGTLFADALYLPVSYDERPLDWSEPATPAAIVARVTDASGAPVRGCGVRFLAGDGSGSAFAQAPETDKNGEIAAYWVAGDERDQTLSAALVDAGGAVVSQSLAGTAYANDEGPQSDEAVRATATRPATVRLSYELPEASTRLRVVLSAATFPHHAFYSAVNIDGFFTGLQNTSDLDAQTEDVADADRVLIASVWNRPEGDAQQLFGAEGLECGPHTQDLGGIRCFLPAAWQPGQDYALELQRTTLALGESGLGYAELGYSSEPCASEAGCTDYTLFFGASSDATLARVVAYRYQSGAVATSFGSFIQPYSELPDQSSCLLTPEYDARFLPYVEGASGFEPVQSADFSADYLSWHNEVCANYEASSDAGGYRLVTGGPRPLGRPELPDEPARPLSLP
ncbi:MAG TPA: hypothetical protein VHB79_29090 [Polyangiaceae bacterium]|nr:hypothetical protein [Polyangiaceae bacterium]